MLAGPEVMPYDDKGMRHNDGASTTLVRFIAESFSRVELMDVASQLPGGSQLLIVLPGETASRLEIAQSFVDAITRRGQLGDEFFAVLLKERPHRANEINEFRQFRQFRQSFDRSLEPRAIPNLAPMLVKPTSKRAGRRTLALVLFLGVVGMAAFTWYSYITRVDFAPLPLSLDALRIESLQIEDLRIERIEAFPRTIMVPDQPAQKAVIDHATKQSRPKPSRESVNVPQLLSPESIKAEFHDRVEKFFATKCRLEAFGDLEGSDPATLSVKLASSGQVLDVQPSGDDKSSKLSKCLAREAKSLEIGPFAGRDITYIDTYQFDGP